MKALLDAILTKIQNSSNGMTGFAGIAPSGAAGPFQDVAPERTGNDYTVFRVQSPGKTIRGFKAGTDGSSPVIQFSVFSLDNATALIEATTLKDAFNRQSLTMTAGAFGGCLSQHDPYSRRAPQIGPTVREIYEGIATLKFFFQG